MKQNKKCIKDSPELCPTFSNLLSLKNLESNLSWRKKGVTDVRLKKRTSNNRSKHEGLNTEPKITDQLT